MFCYHKLIHTFNVHITVFWSNNSSIHILILGTERDQKHSVHLQSAWLRGLNHRSTLWSIIKVKLYISFKLYFIYNCIFLVIGYNNHGTDSSPPPAGSGDPGAQVQHGPGSPYLHLPVQRRSYPLKEGKC